MRQYANPNQSGTVSSSGFRKDPNEAIIDRVMQIAQRVVGAENVIKNQSAQLQALTTQVKTLTEQNAELKKKIDNIALKASGQEFKKPETKSTRRKSAASTKAVEEPVTDSILDEGVEV